MVSEENQEFHRKTFALDTIRAVPAGVVETLGTTFTILLANRVFQAGDMAKASLVAMPSLGLLLSLFVVQGVRRSGMSVNAMLALMMMMMVVVMMMMTMVILPPPRPNPQLPAVRARTRAAPTRAGGACRGTAAPATRAPSSTPRATRSTW